jgi:hypothetical protein
MLMCVCCTSMGCVLVFDRSPARTPNGDLVDNGCTSHYAATVVDVLAGTASLAGGVLGFGLSELAEGFVAAGIIGIAGAVLHYASAASNDVAECKRAKWLGKGPDR